MQVAESAPVAEPDESIIERTTSSIEVTSSLKTRGLDFAESIRIMNAKISRINENADIVSQKSVGRFRMARVNLEEFFSSKEINTDEAIFLFSRLTSSFEELSMMPDREFAKISEDNRKSLIYAIDAVRESALSLKRDESIAGLKRSINRMLDRVEGATNRLRRGRR